jgi:hypothetical protein
MSNPAFLNLVKQLSSTTGTGTTIALGAAVAGFNTIALAGGVDGTTYRFAFHDGVNSEIFSAVYHSGANNLTGRTTLASTNGNAAINLTGNQQIIVCAAAEDVANFLQASNNLSDVVAATARTNLGLGSIATQSAANVAITGGTWTDTTSVAGNAGTFYLGNYFGFTGGTGVVDRFNRVFIGPATVSSSDLATTPPYLPTTKCWLDSLTGLAFIGAAQLGILSTTGELAVVGAARTSDFRTWAGSASSGSEGLTGVGVNDDTLSLATNGTTASGNATLHFASVPAYVINGMLIMDSTSPSVIPAATTVLSTTSTTVVMSANATGAGVGSGNTIIFGATSIAAGIVGLVFRLAGAGGETLNQFDANNGGSLIDEAPFTSNTGATYALGLTSGAYPSLVANSPTAACYIASGGTKPFRKGFLFFDGAFDTALGAGGQGVAAEMRRGHSYRWLNSGGTTDAEFWGDALGLNIVGTTTNNSAAAGTVGEYISASVAAASPSSLTTATPINLASISLTAGDWDVDSNVSFVGNGAATISFLGSSISTTSAALDTTTPGRYCAAGYPNTILGSYSGIVSSVVPKIRISLGSTTTVYLVVEAVFGAGTVSAWGIISARRVR